MKKQNLLVSFFAIAALVSCTKPNGGNSNSGDNSQPGGDVPPDTVAINDFGTVKLEAEKFNVDNWQSDDSFNGEKVITDEKASGGAPVWASRWKYSGWV